jgi:hypothetical protein
MSVFSRLSMGIVSPKAESAPRVTGRRFQSMEFGVGLPSPTSERVGSGAPPRSMLSIGFDAYAAPAIPGRSTSWALPWEEERPARTESAEARPRVVWSRRVGM